ncbi:hypothetical protein L3077_04560 [Haemophilus seminalis]|jgi:hypothetical protein|uniref:hypothetical protein n=1 Tax=Haemophilus sp. SZY H68 TaxID=2839969 RepID=UPI001C054F89|nr:hypothetical protein [Haemophilus sp. SZY H68]UJZ90755.1 hypothetical protein L3077_04560 [Haemophilus seminalis]
MKHQSYISVPLFFLIVSSLVIAQVSIASNITYVDSTDQKSFSSEISDNDVQLLGQSIELKVYKMDEMSSSQTIYESPAGICKGFKARGVNYTNSTHNYLSPNDKTEYYGSVTGATIYGGKNTQNLSYVPVYSISDKKVSERIQIIENKKLKEKAVNNVSEGKAVLTEVICK